MAIKKIIEVDINTNADEAAKEFDNVAKAVNVANDSLEGLNKTFEEANGDIQPLTARMGEAEDRLYELAAAGDTASVEYQGLLTKVGEYRKVQIQTDLAVDNAAQTMSQKLGGALTGATSGFAAVQGAMALTGSESIALEKSLLKVQGAMAFQQGIQGVLEYSKSTGLAGKVQKAFNLILKANPLALLVTALIAVIGYFAIFTDGIDIAIQALKDFGDFIGLTDNAGEAAHEAEMLRIEEAKKAREDSFNELQSQFDREIKLQEALGKSSFKLTQQKIQNSINFQKQQAKELEFALESLSSMAKGSAVFQKAIEESEATIKTLNTSIEESENQLKINILKNNKEKTNSYKEYAAERLSQARKIQDLENSILEEGVEKEVEISKVNFERLIADIKETGEEKKRLTEIYLFQQQEAENEIRNRFRQDQLKAEEEFQVETMMPLMEELGQREIKIKKIVADAVVEIDIDKSKKQIAAMEAVAATEKAIEDAKFANASAGIALVKSLAGDNKKLQAAAIVAESAVGIAKIIIATQTSNAATIAQGAALAIPSAGASVAAASALVLQNNIAAGISIGATVAAAGQGLKALGTGGSVEGGNNPPSGGVGGGSVPNFNVVGDSGVNQLATLQTQPTMAYVVSGDVTTAQALDRNRVQNATL